MGKTTLYHPVALNVIRGAVEYCGFKFGKIAQVRADNEHRTARYTATIVAIPKRMKDQSDFIVLIALRDCFMDDVSPHWLRRKKNGDLCVDLSVDLSKVSAHEMQWIAEDGDSTPLEEGRNE